jgi:outer membrane protein TolC
MQKEESTMFRRRIAALLLAAAAAVTMHVPARAAETPAPTPPATTAAAPAPTLSMEEAVATAIRSNPTVAIADQEVVASRGQAEQATAAVLPRVSATIARTTRISESDTAGTQTTGSRWSTNGSITQPLYTWGALSKGLRAARQVVRSSESSAIRAQEEVAYLARQAYYRVLTSQESVRVQQDVLAAAQEHLRVAQLRYDAGIAPQYDVLAAEARVARVQQVLASAQGGLSISWAGLSRVMAAEVPMDTVLTSPRPATVQEVDLPALIGEATQNRADVQAARAQVSVGEARTAIARTGNLPKLAAVASYSFAPSTVLAGAGPGGSDILVSQSGGAVVLAATWDLFTGGSVHGATAAAKAGTEQARQEVRARQQQAEEEVRNAYYGITTAQAQVTAAGKEVTQAQEAYRIAQVRYQEGVSTSVEVLDAQTNLGDARNNLNNAIFALNLAVAQLDLAVGRTVGGPAAPAGTN